MNFLPRSKKILTSLLASCVILTGTTSAFAEDAGILELSIRHPWQITASKRATCIATAELTKGHRLQVAFDGETKNTSILLLTDGNHFIVNRLYQSDIYIDFDTHFTNKAVPINTRDIELVTMDTRRFERLFDGIEEISFGLDDTLYVINIANIPFPLADFDACVQTKMPKDRGILSTIASLNPFALPEDPAPVDTPSEEQGVELTEMVAELKQQDAAPKEKGFRPFLTSYRPQPYSLQPAKKASGLKRLTRPEADESEKDLDVQAQDKPSYDEIVEYNRLYEQEQQGQSCGGAGANGVYEFSQIPEAELPPQMQGLHDFMTGNNNNDEEKELIKSLLVQLDLLEKEKEALRRRAPEDLEPLAVIRSCSREEGVISDLRSQLQQAETDKFDLLKQREIADDIANVYEDIEGDITEEPPTPPKPLKDSPAPQSTTKDTSLDDVVDDEFLDLLSEQTGTAAP